MLSETFVVLMIGNSKLNHSGVKGALQLLINRYG